MIVTLRDIRPAVAMGWYVPSECDPSKSYWVWRNCVGRWICNCPDFERRGGPCKHALAVRLLQACEREEAYRQAGVIPFPTRTLADDEPIPFELSEQAYTELDALPEPAA